LNSTLQSINSVIKDLELFKTNVPSTVPLYTSLIDFILGVREDLTVYEEKAF
jgi:hypothetical protein